VCRTLDDEARTCTRHMLLSVVTVAVPSGGDKDEVGTMNRVVRLAVAGVMALGAVLVPGMPAQAATPEIQHTKLNLTLTGIDQCGITVNSVVQGTLIQQAFVRKSGTVVLRTIASVTSTLTNPANNKVVHVDSAGPDTFTPDGVENPDGTFTFTDTLTGRDIRIYTSHSNVLLRDAGYLSIVTVTNADGDVLSEQVTMHGPHGFAGDFDAMCDAITAAIG
jgi:hypothetical protein